MMFMKKIVLDIFNDSEDKKPSKSSLRRHVANLKVILKMMMKRMILGGT